MNNPLTTKHRYYCWAGNFYKSGSTHEYKTFKDFVEEWKDADIDMNRIHRFDFCDEVGELSVYYIGQRKATLWSCHIKIQNINEQKEEIINFLKPHADYNRKLWEGI